MEKVIGQVYTNVSGIMNYVEAQRRVESWEIGEKFPYE
jgi:hypothetical protein